MARKLRPPEPKRGVPGYMVSFGDMMTLILTFFILLVSMSKEQQVGLLAKGLGSFVAAIKSHGLNGVLDASEEREIFEHMRRRFNLPPEEDPERKEEHLDASELEVVRAEAVEALRPHDEIGQPMVATFEPDSARLTEAARLYLDRLAPTLRPGRGQLLVLEGRSGDAGPRFQGDHRWLAFSRAAAVRDFLVERHGFVPERVEARAWLFDGALPNEGTRSVDARLVTPARRAR